MNQEMTMAHRAPESIDPPSFARVTKAIEAIKSAHAGITGSADLSPDEQERRMDAYRSANRAHRRALLARKRAVFRHFNPLSA